MRRILLLFIFTFLVVFTGFSDKTEKLIACGDDQVIVIEKKIPDNEEINILWKWKVSEATGLPPAYQKYMIPTDECKPVDNNTKILITSSGGGVALVDLKTKKSLFYAHVPMAHSAEYLPHDRIIVALSTAAGGNSLEVFDVSKPEKVIFKDSLYSGHGVVWIPGIRRLYALGYDELRSYSLKNWDSEKPELQLEKKWTLPDKSGHDLTAVSDSILILTTANGVWSFKTQKEQFTTFGLLDSVKNVKSVNYNVSAKELVYTKGEIEWWTHNIYCREADKTFTITIPDINIYKVRVFPE